MTQVLPNNSRYDKTLIYESLRNDDIYIKEEEINQIPQMNDGFSYAEIYQKEKESNKIDSEKKIR